MSLLIFIVILVALIWVHELGHFSAAKLLGIRVDKFAIGFPPKLLSVKWGETEYSFNLLLVGGYVSIHGEDPGTDAHDKRSMASKPRPLQAIVILAGIVMNLLVGWLLLSAGYVVGMPVATDHAGFGTPQEQRVELVYVLPNSPAETAGLAAGDDLLRVTSGTGEIVPTVGSNGAEVQDFISAHQNETLIFSVGRETGEENIVVVPKEGVVEGRKAVGIQMADVGTLKLPVHLALLEGAVAGKELTIATAQGVGTFLSQLVLGQAKWDQVSGPIGIAGAGAGAVRDGFSAAAFLTALISINLAIVNLLPIPGLDGGRFLILVIEGIIRRPLSPRIIGGLSVAGFLLVIALMIAVTYNDITKLIG